MMSNNKLKTVSLKLAEAILLHRGEISLRELKALPFIDEEDSELLAKYLSSKFNLRIHVRKFKNEEWEEVLSMK